MPKERRYSPAEAHRMFPDLSCSALRYLVVNPGLGIAHAPIANGSSPHSVQVCENKEVSAAQIHSFTDLQS